jgi:hypothetical protein
MVSAEQARVVRETESEEQVSGRRKREGSTRSVHDLIEND